MSSLEQVFKDKEQRIQQQELELNDKSNIVLTRSRMLEIAQEKNIFARKMFYTLISVIIFIIILTLYIYSTSSSSIKMNKNMRFNR
jgi:hypothetical protein